eukprot:366767-Amphidinium_carterae.1
MFVQLWRDISPDSLSDMFVLFSLGCRLTQEVDGCGEQQVRETQKEHLQATHCVVHSPVQLQLRSKVTSTQEQAAISLQ